MFDALESWLSSLTPTTQFQLYIAIITTLGLVVSLSTFIYNVNKSSTKIKIEIKRDSDTPLARKQPLKNQLLVQVINKSPYPVTIKEVGIVGSRKKYINFVGMRGIFVILKEQEEMMGILKRIDIFGTVNSQSMEVALIIFSSLEETYKIIKEEKELSIEKPGYLGKRNIINAYEELMKSYNATTQVLTVKPYTMTTTGQIFIGKKTKIQFGNLHKAV
jgi:hypothetical protein